MSCSYCISVSMYRLNRPNLSAVFDKRNNTDSSMEKKIKINFVCHFSIKTKIHIFYYAQSIKYFS